MSYPSNSESVAQDQIKAFVERILRMKEEARAIKDDIREIYAEAKGNGFDKTVLGKLVNYVEKRTKDSAAVEEGEALWELYLTAYYGSGTRNALAHTHETSEIAAVEKKPSRLAHNQKIAGASPAPATSNITVPAPEPSGDGPSDAGASIPQPEGQQIAPPAQTGRGTSLAGAEGDEDRPPLSKQWGFKDKPHHDCLNPTQCGGFSNLGLCEPCKQAAA